MPALVELNKILEAPSTSDGDKLRAVSMVLDRTGFGKGVTIEHKQDKPWEVTMQAIIMPMAEDHTTGTEDIEDAEVVEESLPPVRDMSKLERFDGPRIVPDAETGRGRVRGSANPLR